MDSLPRVRKAIFTRPQIYSQQQALPGQVVHEERTRGNPSHDFEINVGVSKDSNGQVTGYEIQPQQGYDEGIGSYFNVTPAATLDAAGEPVSGDFLDDEINRYLSDSKLISVQFAVGRAA